jgi:hypothetical protein
MANGFSPYQIAAPTVNLMGQSGVKKKKQQMTDLATTRKMGTMEEQFQSEIDRLGMTSSQKEEGTKTQRNLERGGKLLSLLFAPLGAGILGGLIEKRRHKRARKARKGMLNLQSKWDKSFLRNKSRDYMSQAESLQLDESGDIIESLKGGLQAGLLSKTFGGDTGGDTFLSKLTGRKDGKVFKGIGEAFLTNKKFDAKKAFLISGLLERFFEEPQY